MTQPALTQADVEYITEHFVPLDDACRRHGEDPEIVRQIETLLEKPRAGSAEWAERLRASVDELDELEREFAAYHRIRFGGPVSRDRLISAVRERYASVFAREPASEIAL